MSDPYAGLPTAPKLFTNQTKVLFSNGAPAEFADLEPIDRAAFRPRQFVVLGDGTRARWDGDQWVDVTPVAQQPFDPASTTIAKVKTHVNDGGDAQAALDAERARGDDARTSLIDWLESQIGD